QSGHRLRFTGCSLSGPAPGGKSGGPANSQRGSDLDALFAENHAFLDQSWNCPIYPRGGWRLPAGQKA
ncbi:hypothetical protein JDF658_27200, partial [Carboxydocella sp. JDF658]